LRPTPAFPLGLFGDRGAQVGEQHGAGADLPAALRAIEEVLFKGLPLPGRQLSQHVPLGGLNFDSLPVLHQAPIAP